jgi:prepilin-type N-terminal cleavage/methylation domain-containing protein
MKRHRHHKGFTLIEVLVVITVLSIIMAFALSNFVAARARARDNKKKSEMSDLKTALGMYYGDFRTYPASYNGGAGKLNYIKGCGANGAQNCDRTICADADFAAGGTGCDFTYMKQFPSDLGTGIFYYRTTGGEDFCLRAVLENASDAEMSSTRAKCASACGANCSGAQRYCVCGD